MRLELHHIRAGYGAGDVLDDVTLVVPHGEIVALLGPNGAGKSTLLRVASGLLAPRAGTVRFDGDDLTHIPTTDRIRRGLCHVTEGRSVFATMTVRENLDLFAYGSGADGIDRAIEAFPRLGERLHQTAGTMSGGEQQMLALARAYVQDASVILLDEISLGLAPIVVDEILDHLHGLVASGATLLVVEQYVTKILPLADRVYVLSQGRIALACEPSEVDGADLAALYLRGTTAIHA